MLMSVRFDNTLYIADVGFGDSFVRPLCLLQGDGVSLAEYPASVPLDSLNQAETEERGVHYRIDSTPQGLVLMRQKPPQQWQAQYLFSLQGHEVSAFYEMCRYHQTSPQSSFTQKSVCSVATATGRKTLSDGRFIETVNHERHEVEITEPGQYREKLLRHFQVSLPQGLSAATWQRLLGQSVSGQA